MSLLAALVLALATAAPPLPDTTLDAAHGLLARGHDARRKQSTARFSTNIPTMPIGRWRGTDLASPSSNRPNTTRPSQLGHLEDDARFPYAAEVGTMLGRSAELAEGRPELALACARERRHASRHPRSGGRRRFRHRGIPSRTRRPCRGHQGRRRVCNTLAAECPPRSHGRAGGASRDAVGADRAGAERLARLGEDTSPSRRLLLAQLWHRAGVTDRAYGCAYERVLDDKQAGALAADASSGLARLLHDTRRFDHAIRQIDRHLRRFEGNAADLRILAARFVSKRETRRRRCGTSRNS